MTSLFAEYGPKAIAELQRRGWTKGDLVEEAVPNPAFDWEDPKKRLLDPYIPISYEDGAVCLLGCLGAAYYGDPRKGEDSDGNGYDDMLRHLAGVINPDWETELSDYKEFDFETSQFKDTFKRKWSTPGEVIVEFNDERAADLSEVISKLQAATATAVAGG